MARHEARIVRRRSEGKGVVTLFFTLMDGRTLAYEAGQYITVYFEGASTPEGKAYSLSSAPHEPQMSITVKNIGEFSGRLHALRVGDAFTISDAYGFFNPQTTRQLVCIGAGVGIAPLWSVLKHEYKNDAARVSHLFYSNKTIGDIAFHDELAVADRRHAGFAVTHHITRQADVPEGVRVGRINLEECLRVAADDAAYLLCGSVEFVRDMWRQLVEGGVAAERISTETFFE